MAFCKPWRNGFMAGEFKVPDDFDRILVAQAESEGFLLLTADELVARYPGPSINGERLPPSASI